jgi:hypothetical protein
VDALGGLGRGLAVGYGVKHGSGGFAEYVGHDDIALAPCSASHMVTLFMDRARARHRVGFRMRHDNQRAFSG